MHLLIMSPRWKWKVLVVDEAHRIKNQKSLLHNTLTEVTEWHQALVINFSPHLSQLLFLFLLTSRLSVFFVSFSHSFQWSSESC